MKKIIMFTAAAVLLFGAEAIAGGHTEEAFFKKDANGDGVVSKEEYLKSSEEKFAKMDADGNGSITKEERKEAFKKWKKEHAEKHKGKKKWKQCNKVKSYKLND